MPLSNRKIIFLLVSLTLLMETLDSNILNTAVPTIANYFEVNPIDIKIALIGYLMSLAVFIPISGWVADKFGLKPVFIAALAVFTVSSLFCGFAATLTQLVVLRCIQGIGGAFMTLARLIVAREYRQYELVEVMNVVVMVMSIGVMLGPFFSGVIVDHFSWPWIFWVNIPVGIFLILLAFFALKDNEPKKVRPFDLLGFVLFGGGFASLCFSLSEMSESHSNWRALLYQVVLSFVLLVFYYFRARRQKNPLIAVKLFSLRTFRISIVANLCTRMGFGSISFLLPLFQQIGLKMSPQLSGFLMMPMAFGVIASKMIGSKVLRKTGYRRYLLVNTTIMAFLLWMYQFIMPDTSIYLLALLTFIFGFFISAQYTGMNSLAMSEISQDELSASNSIVSTNQMVSQTIGIALAAILLRYFSWRHGLTALTDDIFHHAFLALGIITLFSTTIFLLLKSDDGQQMLIKQ